MGNCASAQTGLAEDANQHAARKAPASGVGEKLALTAGADDGINAKDPQPYRDLQAPAPPRAGVPSLVPSASTSTTLTRLSGRDTLPLDGRNLVLIVWDIENVRLPLCTAPGLTPKNVVRYLKKHFIYGPGRTEFRTVAALTERSLGRIRRDHPAFVEQVVPDLTLLLASAVHQKRNADVVLKKELHQFVTEHAHLARSCPGQLSIVLISGDEDFLEAVQGALAAGFAVELVTHDTASGALLAQGYARPPTLWSRFLRDASGVADVVLPYGDEQMAGVLGPRSVVLAGFGPRRGGEAARAQAARLLRAAVAACSAGSGSSLGGASGSHGGAAGGGGAGGMAVQQGLPAMTLVEPSFGAFSGSCVVLVTPRDGDDAAALAERLRAVQLPPEPGLLQQQGGGSSGSGGGGGVAGPVGAPAQVALLPGEQRLAVFEARRMLCLQLHADDLWMPNQAHQGHGASAPEPGLGSDGEGDAAAAVAAAEGDAGGVDMMQEERAGGGGACGGGSFSAAASGRGLHDRLADACVALAGALSAYRLPRRPGGSPSKSVQQQPHSLQVLCRFMRVPAPGEMCLTLLAAVADEAADLLAALSHLQAATAPQLQRQHGVTLTAQLQFSAEEVTAAVEAARMRAAAGPAVASGTSAATAGAEPAGALEGNGLLGALEQQQQQRAAAKHRLPSLAFTPQPQLHAGGQAGQLAGPIAATMQSFEASHAQAPPPAGVDASLQALQPPAPVLGQDLDGGDASHDQKGRKKKKKKNKKRKNKNRVVPL
ncbi:hypothetical protein HYH02_008463 [Chlamydomonas schloesseri]|uniref:NYN domain-containing protein n=1 Tax=Chlamydomonas schloesseri TaxID=2026947 RepID=A0A835WFE9_9CHLO|nr:hypothetical protein HYH02_008463 [Chlamydomonas schloesseri]|eukprot:KAG2446472.1 hypothetical protein HYH02_008463 [Chlamydomonas schloesseri]